MFAEEIIENIGSFGYWQRVIFTCISIPDMIPTFAILLPVFVGASPNWSCAGTNRTRNSSSVQYNVSYNSVGDNENILIQDVQNQCECEVKDFEEDITSVVTEFDLVCGKKFITEMLMSITFAGIMVGGFVFAQMSDTFGRKKPFFTAFIMISVLSLASSFSVNWQMYAVLRFFTGVSMGGFFSIAGVYPIEFVGRRWRTLCGTLGFWAFAEMILALLAYYIRDWRYLTMTTSVIGFSLVTLWFIIPESPRWLIRSGHIDEAREVCTKIAHKNGRPAPDLAHLDKLLITKEINDELHKKYTYIDLFRNRHLLRLTLLASVLWFVTFAIYYNMSYNLKNLSGDRYLNMFYAGLVDLVAMFAVMIFTNIIGRRISVISYIGIAAVGHVIILILYIINKEESYAIVIKVAALIGKASVLSAMYTTQIWCAELFPTHVRNVGVGMGMVLGRVGALLAPQIVVLGYYFEPAPYIVILGLCCMAIPVCCFLSETNGKALPDDIQSETDQCNEEMKSVSTNI